MRQDRQSRILCNIVSPYGLALISYAFFLFACLIPPSVYTHYMSEPDLMFLDPATILYYTLCLCAFLSGVWLFQKIFPPPIAAKPSPQTLPHPLLSLLTPLLIALLITLTSEFLLVKRNPLMIPLLLAQQAGQLRNDDGSGIDLSGTLNSSALFLTGVVWWCFWRSRQLALSARGKTITKLTLLLAFLVLFVSSSLNVSRHGLIVALVGFVVCFILQKIASGQLDWALVSRTAFTLGISGCLFFYLVNSLRYGTDGNLQVGQLIGYTISSYNRLAALLQGKLHYLYSGKGIYLSTFLSFNHPINRIIPFARVLDVPDFFIWWRSEFNSVAIAGLDSSWIFSGTFGDIFIEFGWFAPLYVFGYGLLYGLVWNWMKRNRMIGIILYPYLAYCVLFWFTTNALFDTDFAALVADVAILALYERIFMNMRQSSARAPARASLRVPLAPPA